MFALTKVEVGSGIVGHNESIKKGDRVEIIGIDHDYFVISNGFVTVNAKPAQLQFV